MSVALRPAADRFATDLPWLRSRHAFSFGRHYDPARTHHGLLLVLNDDVVAPGAGFDTHPHRDMEIVTWVLEGALVHQDSEGHHGLVHPGLAQRMSAGSGILHSERNDRGVDGHAAGDPVHFLQMWVLPDTAGRSPSYAQAGLDEADLGRGWVAVASGDPRQGAAVPLGQRGATMLVRRLRAGERAALPSDVPGELGYLHVARSDGGVQLEGAGVLQAGDAAALTHERGLALHALGASEVVLWLTAAPSALR